MDDEAQDQMSGQGTASSTPVEKQPPQPLPWEVEEGGLVAFFKTIFIVLIKPKQFFEAPAVMSKRNPYHFSILVLLIINAMTIISYVILMLAGSPIVFFIYLIMFFSAIAYIFFIPVALGWLTTHFLGAKWRTEAFRWHTRRICYYSMATAVAELVSGIGGIAHMVWWVVLVTKGLTAKDPSLTNKQVAIAAASAMLLLYIIPFFAFTLLLIPLFAGME